MVAKSRTGTGLLPNLLGALGLAVLLVGSEEPTEQVTVVVPDGFAGRIRIVFGDRGDPSERIDGRTVYRIPESGVLFVRGENRFLGWAQIEAKTANGTAISVASPSYGQPDETLFRVSGSTNDGTEYWAVVGTRTVLRESNRARHVRESDAIRARANR